MTFATTPGLEGNGCQPRRATTKNSKWGDIFPKRQVEKEANIVKKLSIEGGPSVGGGKVNCGPVTGKKQRKRGTC